MRYIKKILYLAIISIIAISTISFSSADDFNLQTAIDNTADGGTLDLTGHPVIYINNKIVINKAITIKESPTGYFVGNNPSVSSFSIETSKAVNFVNLNFNNFDKAAVNLNSYSNVNFTNCFFTNGKTSIYGSANSHVNIENSSFLNNNVRSTIYLLKGSNLVISGSIFNKNSVNYERYLYEGGSCINTIDSNISISRTFFTNNNGPSGGVIYFNNNDLTTNLDISNSYIFNNGADIAGGFLYATGSERYTVNADNNTFRENHINVNGDTSSPIYDCGGVFFSTGRGTNNYEFTLTNNRFHDNLAATGFIAGSFGYNGGKYNIFGTNNYSNDNDAKYNGGYKSKSSDVFFNNRKEIDSKLNIFNAGLYSISAPFNHTVTYQLVDENKAPLANKSVNIAYKGNLTTDSNGNIVVNYNTYGSYNLTATYAGDNNIESASATNWLIIIPKMPGF
ncbi:MAG: hypothetical protein LBT10_06645 [Methanobrevibacter sp.]|jgi:hypothetical protein|nr:hypothetical protein [Methanobrevibacter sp.]